MAQDEALLRIAGKSEKHAIEARLQDLRGKVAAAQEIKDGHIRVLETLGLKAGKLTDAVREIRKASGVDTVQDPNAESTFEAL